MNPAGDGAADEQRPADRRPLGRPARPASSPRKYMRYVGSSTNPHGLTVADHARAGTTGRGSRPQLRDALAQLVAVDRRRSQSRIVPSAATKQRDRVGDDAERLGRTRPVGIPQQLVVTPRSAANVVIVAAVSHGLTPTKRTSSPSSASTAAKSASSRAHGGHVEYHRLTTIGRPSGRSATGSPAASSERQRPAAARSAAAGSSAPPGSGVLAGLVEHDVGRRRSPSTARLQTTAPTTLTTTAATSDEQRGPGPSQPHHEATDGARPGSGAAPARARRTGGADAGTTCSGRVRLGASRDGCRRPRARRR